MYFIHRNSGSKTSIVWNTKNGYRRLKHCWWYGELCPRRNRARGRLYGGRISYFPLFIFLFCSSIFAVVSVFIIVEFWWHVTDQAVKRQFLSSRSIFAYRTVLLTCFTILASYGWPSWSAWQYSICVTAFGEFAMWHRLAGYDPKSFVWLWTDMIIKFWWDCSDVVRVVHARYRLKLDERWGQR